MTPEEKTIGDSFISSIITTGVDIGSEIVEVGLDTFIKQSDILKDIPIFGILVKTVSIGTTIRDKIFASKITSFLTESSKLSDQEREILFKKLDKEGKKRDKIGEALLIIIDQLDSVEKAKLMGKLFFSLGKGVITYNQFLKFSHILNKSFVEDLKRIPDFKDGLSDSIGVSLLSIELLFFNSYSANEEIDENVYKTSKLGWLFYRAVSEFK